MEMQRNQAQLDQLASGPSNSQPWGYPPQQLIPQLEWPSNYNVNINTGNIFMHPSNMTNSYNAPTPFPMQQGPIQQGQMQLEPMPLTPVETTGFTEGFNQAFAPNYIEGVDWHSANHLFQAQQGAMNEFYSPPPPPSPQQQTQFQFNQLLWTPGPASSGPGMSRLPVGHAVTTGQGPLVIGRNIPSRPPFYPRGAYGAVRPKRQRHVSRDAVGVDITKIGERRPSTLPTPSPEKKIQAPIVPPQPDSAVPESAKDQQSRKRKREDHPEEVARLNSIDNPVVVDDLDDPAPEKLARPNSIDNPVIVDHLGGLCPVKEALERAKQDDATNQAEKGPEDKQAEVEWPGDPSEYPAECSEPLRLPGCQYRAQGICIGSPRPEYWRDQGETRRPGLWVVYAVRRPQNDGGVGFKLVKPGSKIQEVMDGQDIQFRDIRLNVNFEGMDEKKVIHWSKYLLSAVPGLNDSITMWTQA